MLKNKKDIPLVLAILLPVLMVLLVAISAYLPGFLVNPKYNFLYVSPSDMNNEYFYDIQDGKLIKRESGIGSQDLYPKPFSQASIRLYIHDILKNESREISFQEAEGLNLSPNLKSKDGFQVTSGGDSGGGLFPFYFDSRADYNNQYLVGRNLSKKLNLQLSNSYYYDNFRFIGWIE